MLSSVFVASVIDMSKWGLSIFIVGAILVILFVVLIYSMVNNRKKIEVQREPNEVGDGTIWRDRKHTFFGLPWSFTVYRLSDERLFVKTGIFTTIENEVRLYRVLDVQLRRIMGQRIMGLGSVVIKSSDRSMKDFVLENVARASDVKELLSIKVEIARKMNRISGREIMVDDNDYDDGEGYIG